MPTGWLTIRGVGVDHYENFPVASVLCPPRIRGAVVAIYHFARTADDIADEGDADPASRLAQLQALRGDLLRCIAGDPVAGPWASMFERLAGQHQRHRLPLKPLLDLLDAFEQDVHNPVYADRDSLLDYCRRSANPIGRLMLHLHGIDDPVALTRSDCICSALQLINFWQDCSVDLPRGRVYLPREDAARHGLTLDDPGHLRDSAASRALLRELCDWARDLMAHGAPLAMTLPGRSGWELRLVVQGGLRVLDRIARMDHATIASRPTLGWADALPVAWGALTLGRTARATQNPLTPDGHPRDHAAPEQGPPVGMPPGAERR